MFLSIRNGTICSVVLSLSLSLSLSLVYIAIRFISVRKKKINPRILLESKKQYRDVRIDECLGSLIKLMKRLPITNLTKLRARCYSNLYFSMKTAHRLLHSSIRFLRRLKKKNIDPISSNAAVNDCCLDCLVNYSRLILLALRNEDENLFPLNNIFHALLHWYWKFRWIIYVDFESCSSIISIIDWKISWRTDLLIANFYKRSFIKYT